MQESKFSKTKLYSITATIVEVSKDSSVINQDTQVTIVRRDKRQVSQMEFDNYYVPENDDYKLQAQRLEYEFFTEEEWEEFVDCVRRDSRLMNWKRKPAQKGERSDFVGSIPESFPIGEGKFIGQYLLISVQKLPGFWGKQR